MTAPRSLLAVGRLLGPVALTLATVFITVGQSARPAAAVDSCAPAGNPKMTVEPWAQTRLGVTGLADSFQGWNVTIAVIGSGVSNTHPQLQGHVTAGKQIGDAGAANSDCIGTGTAAAGAAAAAPVSGTTVRGLAPQAVIVPITLPSALISPTADVPDKDQAASGKILAAAILTAADLRADVIILPSVNLAGSPELQQAVSQADEQGIVLIEGVPAKFNSGAPFPLAYPEVLGVLPTDKNAVFAETTATGGAADLAAPGTGALVLVPSGGYNPAKDDRGTASAAAAGFAAGAAALLIDSNPRITPATIRRTLVDSGIRQANVDRPPLLNPAAALGPVAATNPAGVTQSWGKLLAPPKDLGNVPLITSVGVALGWLAGLALVAATVGAFTRGRRRRWAPAEPSRPVVPPRQRTLAP